MTDSIWLPYHMGVRKLGCWRPLCENRFRRNSAIVHEGWRFLELEESHEPGTMVCEECLAHPDLPLALLGST
jgi:hypothetical protein